MQTWRWVLGAAGAAVAWRRHKRRQLEMADRPVPWKHMRELLDDVERGKRSLTEVDGAIFNTLSLRGFRRADALECAIRFVAAWEHTAPDTERANSARRLLSWLFAQRGRLREAETARRVVIEATERMPGARIQVEERLIEGPAAIDWLLAREHVELASVLFHQGRHADALAALDEAQRRLQAGACEPGTTLARSLLAGRGWCLLRMGRRREAEEVVAELGASSDPHAALEGAYLACAVALAGRDPVSAEKALGRAEEIEAREGARAHPRLWRQRAVLLAHQGRGAEAERCLKEAATAERPPAHLFLPDEFRTW